MSAPITYDDVYYVDSASYNLPNQLAIRPRVNKTSIAWEDTSRGTRYTIEKVDTVFNNKGKDPDKIIVTLDGGKEITLTKMTLEIYNKNVRKGVLNQPQFETIDQLRQFYLENDFL